MASNISNLNNNIDIDSVLKPTPDTNIMTVICHDYSGSTNGGQYYHNFATQIFSKISQVPHRICLWDDTYKEVTDDKYKNIISTRIGRGGTLTSKIADYFKNNIRTFNTPIDIIIITDGEVQMSDISICDKILEEINKSSIKICSKTMRPYTYQTINTHWKDAYIQKYNKNQKYNNIDIFDNTQERRPTKLVFSGDKYYLDFIETYNFYPNIYDYITFCFNKLCNNQYKFKTIPNITFDDILSRYSHIIDNITPESFTYIAKCSQNRDERIRMESL